MRVKQMNKKKNITLDNESPIIDKMKNDTENAIDDNKINDIKTEYEETKKETRGRKKKIDIDFEDKQKAFSDVVTFNASLGLEILIARMPKPKPLTNEERENFNIAFSSLAKKYYSSVQKFGEELNFSLILFFILLPRFEFKKKDSKKVEETNKEKK